MEKLIEFEGIGTHWWIKIFDELDQSAIDKLGQQVFKLVKDFEKLYSRFLPDSLVSQLNKDKYLLNPPAELFKMIRLGLNAKKISQGHFNIAVGKVLEGMGYDANYSFTSSENQTFSDQIVIREDRIDIGKETKVDLGGIGKGFLIDKVKDFFQQDNIEYYSINAGGDIYASSDRGAEIEFALENPFNTAEMIGTIKIKNQSIASSSGNRRRWKDQRTNQDLNHLVDMVSQQNVVDIVGVYTISSNASNADIASTSIFVSPPELHAEIAKFWQTEYLAIFSDKNYIKSSNYPAELFK